MAPLAAAGGFAYVDPDEPAAHRRIVAVRAHGSGKRDAGAADGRRERPERPAGGEPGRPDIAVLRATETMMRAVVVLAGRREAQRPVTTGRRSEAAEVAFRGMSPVGRIR